ncbi:hypothetical protein LIS77_10210 [Cytobacillus firmus]|uniref:hypothetical protein n=1 Tax=Cytobacillus firmus TaxID=1399 RepID=UPI00207A214B|nr:hypothetical protein [Cytobacillus firmus]USK40838.1 hypothetical protein LIS77_10210 [Cytobacillus firmus]
MIKKSSKEKKTLVIAQESKLSPKLATNAQFGVINARFFHILIFLPVIKMHFILFSR